MGAFLAILFGPQRGTPINPSEAPKANLAQVTEMQPGHNDNDRILRENQDLVKQNQKILSDNQEILKRHENILKKNESILERNNKTLEEITEDKLSTSAMLTEVKGYVREVHDRMAVVQSTLDRNEATLRKLRSWWRSRTSRASPKCQDQSVQKTKQKYKNSFCAKNALHANKISSVGVPIPYTYNV